MRDLATILPKIKALMPIEIVRDEHAKAWCVQSHGGSKVICFCREELYADIICTALYEAEGAIEARLAASTPHPEPSQPER